MIVFPLAQDFDEGIGRDIVRYSDLDTVNFVTASFASGNPVLWNNAGAMKSGSLGDSNIDIIVSGNLNDGKGLQPLCVEQRFITGEEDLYVDVTKAVSGVLANQIGDHGFLIAYSGSFEKMKSHTFSRGLALEMLMTLQNFLS